MTKYIFLKNTWVEVSSKGLYGWETVSEYFEEGHQITVDSDGRYTYEGFDEFAVNSDTGKPLLLIEEDLPLDSINVMC